MSKHRAKRAAAMLDGEDCSPREAPWSKVDKQGRRWRGFAVVAPEDEISLYDAVAAELKINRSAMVRVAMRQFCAAVKR